MICSITKKKKKKKKKKKDECFKSFLCVKLFNLVAMIMPNYTLELIDVNQVSSWYHL